MTNIAKMRIKIKEMEKSVDQLKTEFNNLVEKVLNEKYSTPFKIKETKNDEYTRNRKGST